MVEEGGAEVRLEAAVKRLELVLGRTAEHSSTGAEDVKRLNREINSLKSELANAQAENDRQSEDLVQTKAKNVTLQSAMDNISARLDGAIDGVQALLEE